MGNDVGSNYTALTGSNAPRRTYDRMTHSTFHPVMRNMAGFLYLGSVEHCVALFKKERSSGPQYI